MFPRSTLKLRVLLGLALLVTGCASPTSVVLAPGSAPRETRVLDWRLRHVRIHHQRVLDALSTIDREMSQQAGVTRALTWCANEGTPDPPISIEADDLTVRALLLEICRQAELGYEIDDRNSPYDIYIKAGRRVNTTSNQAMQPTAGRRTPKFPMTSTPSPAAKRALASGG